MHRLLADLVVVHGKDHTLLDVDVHQVQVVCASLEALCFGEDVQIEDCTADQHRIEVHGPAAIDIANARVWIGEFDLFSNGEPHPENEAAASDYLSANDAVVIGVDLGTGPFEGEVWSCDLTRDYVSINADYRS